jgi:putative redox protein
MPARIEVLSVGGDRYVIGVRDHAIVVDQPLGVGGEDVGPTPTELFVASLASCVAFYAGRYLQHHDIGSEGFSVRAGYQMADEGPGRVAEVDLAVTLPADFPEDRVPGLMSVVRHCTVHNSLRRPPEVRIAVHQPAAA